MWHRCLSGIKCLNPLLKSHHESKPPGTPRSFPLFGITVPMWITMHPPSTPRAPPHLHELWGFSSDHL